MFPRNFSTEQDYQSEVVEYVAVLCSQNKFSEIIKENNTQHTCEIRIHAQNKEQFCL